jgi:type I restriction enzyme M protein
LLIYAARHYRELSAQNELRPQDVMRMLVHYHAYGNRANVPALVVEHRERIRKLIDLREEDEIGRLQAEYQDDAEKSARLHTELDAMRTKQGSAKTKADKEKVEVAVAKLEKQCEKVDARLLQRDEKIADASRRADEDREDVTKVGDELIALYGKPDELLKHARVVDLTEIEENEFNLNIPRYVDTFEPEPHLDVKDALRMLTEAERAVKIADADLKKLLMEVGYAG